MSQRQQIVEQVVHLDYGRFKDIDFRRCRLVFSGGWPPYFEDCSFDANEFILDGAANNTAAYMQMLMHSSENGKEMVLHHLLGLPVENERTHPE
jgi:hypothetical protein